MADATARDTKGKKDSGGSGSSSKSGGGQGSGAGLGGSGELSISHILGTSDLLSGGDDPLLDLGYVPRYTKNLLCVCLFVCVYVMLVFLYDGTLTIDVQISVLTPNFKSFSKLLKF